MARPDAPFYQDKSTPEGDRKRGYQTGLTWTHDWRPGGPWIPSRDRLVQDADWDAYCTRKAKCNRAYLEGFDAGLAAQQKAR